MAILRRWWGEFMVLAYILYKSGRGGQILTALIKAKTNGKGKD
jgi:hypothetical protein